MVHDSDIVVENHVLFTPTRNPTPRLLFLLRGKGALERLWRDQMQGKRGDAGGRDSAGEWTRPTRSDERTSRGR